MTCIVKKHHLKVLFKEMQFVAFFIFHMEKTRMQVKNDLRCLRQKRARLNVRKNCFSNRVVDGWNALPESVVTAPALNTFKSRLNKHWRNHPYKFKAACYMTNQEIEGEHPSRSVYRSHEDLDDVEVQ